MLLKNRRFAINLSRYLFLLLHFTQTFTLNDQQCRTSSSNVCHPPDSRKFVLYDVNPREGFNLRRDVYIRLATLFNRLRRESKDWHLVLPPWNRLYHWRSSTEEVGNSNLLPWGLFFDLKSLQEYAPVVESFEFFEDEPFRVDHVVILQHYPDLWEDDFTWEEKWNVSKCHQEPTNFVKRDGFYEGTVLGFPGVVVAHVSCVSYQGTSSGLPALINALGGRTIVILHAEVILHDYYGGPEYWQCRKSMKFSKELIAIADAFREKTLPKSTHADDKNNSSFAVGDDYLCVHLRRRDYLVSHPQQVPNISWAAIQLKTKLERLRLDNVFVATDSTTEEFDELASKLLPYKTVRYIPPRNALRTYKDGGVAIVDQIICSHARYFLGTFESTFSFRIQEERELMNFHPDATFNRLCGDHEGFDCKQPTRWLKAI